MNEKYEYKKRFFDMESEEKWINEMAEKGLALKEIKGLTVNFLYRFEPCDKKYVYRVDYNTENTLDAITSPYISFVTDTYGCDFVCLAGGKIYFRKAAERGDFPPVYTDLESRIEAEKKLFYQMLVKVMSFIILLNITIFNCVNAFHSDSVLSFWGFIISFAAFAAAAIGVFCVVFFALIALGHRKKIKELKNMRNEKGGE